MLGALGWAWLVAAALAIGVGSRLGIAAPADPGWTRSAGAAWHQVLAPIGDPRSLAAAAVFALAAAAIGPVLRAGHVALAAVGIVLWSAGLFAALRALEPHLALSPLVPLTAASILLWLERRNPLPRPRQRRLPLRATP